MPDLSVKHAMLRNPPAIAANDTMREAAERMNELQAPLLVVRDGGAAPLGIVTDRDMTQLVASGRDPARTCVRDAMTEAVCCHERDDLEDAAWLMERHGVRRLVVVDDRRALVGVVSVDDVARVFTTRLAGDVLRHTPSLG
jgi:CBS domain-containing protein